MKQSPEPFALVLYRRFLSGETVEQLSVSLAIPAARVDQRIRAAALYTERLKSAGDNSLPIPSAS